jgi:hypothetical protein
LLADLLVSAKLLLDSCPTDTIVVMDEGERAITFDLILFLLLLIKL